MRPSLAGLVQAISTRLVLDDGGQVGEDRQPTLAELVEEARREWLAAGAHFDAVSDHDLIDHAIFMLDAAEKRYTYLLRQVRLHGRLG